MKTLNNYITEKLLINKHFERIDVQGLKEACEKHLKIDYESRDISSGHDIKNIVDTVKSYFYRDILEEQKMQPRKNEILEEVYNKIFNYGSLVRFYQANDYDWETRTKHKVALRPFIKQIDEAGFDWEVIFEEKTINHENKPDVYVLKYTIQKNIAILVEGGELSRMYTFSFKD